VTCGHVTAHRSFFLAAAQKVAILMPSIDKIYIYLQPIAGVPPCTVCHLEEL